MYLEVALIRLFEISTILLFFASGLLLGGFLALLKFALLFMGIVMTPLVAFVALSVSLVSKIINCLIYAAVTGFISFGSIAPRETIFAVKMTQ